MKQSLLVRFVILMVLVATLAWVAPAQQGMTNMVKAAHAAGATVTLELPLPAETPAPSPWSEAEIDCLARTVYGESRNQPFNGQVAVAAVVVSRSLNPKWPNDLCAVVRQPKQFAGYWVAKNPPAGTRSKAWESAYAAARLATDSYGALPESYRKVYYFTVRHERSAFHAKLPLQGYIADHAFFRDLGS